MKKTIFLFFSFLFISQSAFSVFDIKYPENLSRLSSKHALSVILRATEKEIEFSLNGKKIAMFCDNPKSAYKSYVYPQKLEPGIYSLSIKDQHETKSIGFILLD